MFTIIIIWSVIFFFPFWPCHVAFGILVLDQALSPCPLQRKRGSLITGTPGNSLISDLFFLHQIPYLLLKIISYYPNLSLIFLLEEYFSFLTIYKVPAEVETFPLPSFLSILSQPSWEVKSEVKSLSHVWLFATPWMVAYQAPLSMEFSRQEYWSGLPFPSPGDLPNPGIEPGSPALQTDALPSEPPGKPFSKGNF